MELTLKYSTSAGGEECNTGGLGDSGDADPMAGAGGAYTKEYGILLYINEESAENRAEYRSLMRTASENRVLFSDQIIKISIPTQIK